MFKIKINKRLNNLRLKRRISTFSNLLGIVTILFLAVIAFIAVHNFTTPDVLNNKNTLGHVVPKAFADAGCVSDNDCSSGFTCDNGDCIDNRPLCTDNSTPPSCVNGTLNTTNDSVADSSCNGGWRPVTTYSCSCNSGWTGADCSTPTDPCAGVSCSNGYTCQSGSCVDTRPSCNSTYGPSSCSGHGTRGSVTYDDTDSSCYGGVDHVTQYSCACDSGYGGSDCSILLSCSNNATNPPSCTSCPSGYYMQGGQCVVDNRSSCNSTVGPTSCNGHGTLNSSDSSAADSSCYGGTRYTTTYSCSCESGWSGADCSTDVRSCSTGNDPVNCVNGIPYQTGTRTEGGHPECYADTKTFNTYSCQCYSGYGGSDCSTVLSCSNGATNYPSCNDCGPGKYMNAGTCEDQVDCGIIDDSGTYCDHGVPVYGNSTYQNDPHCIGGQQEIAQYTCQCETDWSGARCDTYTPASSSSSSSSSSSASSSSSSSTSSTSSSSSSTPTCSNGATNYPGCNSCPGSELYLDNQCVDTNTTPPDACSLYEVGTPGTSFAQPANSTASGASYNGCFVCLPGYIPNVGTISVMGQTSCEAIGVADNPVDVEAGTSAIILQVLNNDLVNPSNDTLSGVITLSGSTAFSVSGNTLVFTPPASVSSRTAYTTQYTANYVSGRTSGPVTVTQYVIPSTADTTSPSISSATSTTANGTYGVGQVVNLTLNFTENVTITANITITLNAGTGASCIIPTSSILSASAICQYTVQAGHNSSDLTISSISGSVKDAANNVTGNLSIPTGQNIADTKNIIIDTTSPILTSITSTTANGSYNTGNTIDVTFNFSENVVVTTALNIVLNAGNGSNVATCNIVTTNVAANILHCTYTVQQGHMASDLNVVSIAGVVKDGVNNSLTTFVLPNGQNLGDNKNIIIDTTPANLVLTVSTPDTSDATPAITGTCTPTAQVVIIVTQPTAQPSITTTCGTGGIYLVDVANAIPIGPYTVSATSTLNASSAGPVISSGNIYSATDRDGDGVPDTVEQGGPNNGDANNDGVPDWQQNTVVVLLTAQGNKYVMITYDVSTALNCHGFSNAEALLESTLPRQDQSYSYIFGLISFTLNCNQADITMEWFTNQDIIASYRKLVQTIPGDQSTYAFQDYSDKVKRIEKFGMITYQSKYTLVDGSVGDSSVADQKILDPVGFATQDTVTPPIIRTGASNIIGVLGWSLMSMLVLFVLLRVAVSPQRIRIN